MTGSIGDIHETVFHRRIHRRDGYVVEKNRRECQTGEAFFMSSHPLDPPLNITAHRKTNLSRLDAL